MIPLAAFERVFVMLGTAIFSVFPNLLAFGSAVSVAEIIRDPEPAVYTPAIGFVLMSCVMFPILVVQGRGFLDFCRTEMPGGKGMRSPAPPAFAPRGHT